MATQPVSIEAYLSASFEYDCEWVEGEIVERHGGEFEHSFVAAMLGTLIFNKHAEWEVLCLMGIRVQTGPTRIRVPDLTVLRAGAPRERILTHPPLIAIEIQSPEDTLRRTTAKVAEYLEFGIEHVWVIDPYARVAYRGTPSGLELLHSGELVIPGTPIRIVLDDLFAELDRI